MKLKPCPFCGGEPMKIKSKKDDNLYVAIICSNEDCWAGTPPDSAWWDSLTGKEEDAWNRRDNGQAEMQRPL